jgi:hypothetical protein
MARQYRPGRTAKGILEQIGDIDTSSVEREKRLVLLDNMREHSVQQIDSGAFAAKQRPQEKIARLGIWLTARQKRRENKYERLKDRLEQGRRWRALGIYERIPHLDVPTWARALLLLILASLDFYVFAEAWAVVEDVADYSSGWFVGGVFGFVVFVVGVFLSNALKVRVTAGAQRRLMSERKDSGIDFTSLVPLEPSRLGLLLPLSIFLVLVIAGVIVRYTGSDDASPAALAIQSLVPVAAVVAEFYLYNPMERREPQPTWIDRWLARRKARWERRLESIEGQKELAKAEVTTMYAVEREVLDIEQQDRGVR